MSEQLSDLLHQRIDDVDVPHPQVHLIAHRGRRLQARRRAATGAVAAVAALVVGVGALSATGGGTGPRGDRDRVADRQDRGTVVSAKAIEAYARLGTWAYGGTVHVGSATWRTDDLVMNLAQTSVGVVVTHQDETADDATYTLVRPDGSTRTLGIPAGVRHVDGDISSPRIAWATIEDDKVDVHVWDLDSDSELWSDTQSAQGARTAGQTIVALLDGDRVDVTLPRGETTTHWTWTWRASADFSGEVRIDDGTAATMRSGRIVVLEDGAWVVRDAATGDDIRSLGKLTMPPLLSPDARTVAVPAYPGTTAGQVIDVATGASASITVSGDQLGWTPGGRLIAGSADDSGLVRCSAQGACGAPQNLDGFDPEQTQLLLGDYLQVG